MDFAVTSGDFAAQPAREALDAGDVSAAKLARYTQLLDGSYVMKDLRQFQKFPHFMESTKRIFNEYPAMVRDMMNNLFIVDGEPCVPLRRKLMDPVKAVGIKNVLKDAKGGVTAL